MSPDISHMQLLHHGMLKNDTKAELVRLPMDVTAAGRPPVVSHRLGVHKLCFLAYVSSSE